MEQDERGEMSETNECDFLLLREQLQALAAKASPDHDVLVSWYPDGKCLHPQFENSRGGIAQDEGDYEFYAALRTAWPTIEAALCLAGCRATRVSIENPSKKRGMRVKINGALQRLIPGGSYSMDVA